MVLLPKPTSNPKTRHIKDLQTFLVLHFGVHVSKAVRKKLAEGGDVGSFPKRGPKITIAKKKKILIH